MASNNEHTDIIVVAISVMITAVSFHPHTLITQNYSINTVTMSCFLYSTFSMTVYHMLKYNMKCALAGTAGAYFSGYYNDQ